MPIIKSSVDINKMGNNLEMQRINSGYYIDGLYLYYLNFKVERMHFLQNCVK